MREFSFAILFVALVFSGLSGCVGNRPGSSEANPQQESESNPPTINDDNVRLRSIPSIDSQVVKLLQKDQRITVIAKTSQKSKVSDAEDYWYKIIVEDADEGWVFGQFLSGVMANRVASIPVIASGKFEKAAIEVWDDSDPTEKRYHIAIWTGDYDITQPLYKQDGNKSVVADIAIYASKLTSGKYKGYYEAGFKNGPGKAIDSKVKEPVYAEITDSTLKIDALGNLYEGGINLTETLDSMHYSGPYEWIGDKR